ncbi:hypothetical protein J6590_106854, partial [Homalodisca vitripennis]
MWSRVPKNNFVGLTTIKFGTFDAIISYSEIKKTRLEVLNVLGVKVRINCAKSLKETNRDRLIKSEIACEEEIILVRRILLDTENVKGHVHEAGVFKN